LDDCHRLWHLALEHYFDPDGFRVAIQTCIQTLRTVTFVLQNSKDKIPGFDDWYAGAQEQLKGDPILRWAVTARNQVEKQGDLESHSMLKAQVIASYLDLFPVLEVKTELFESLDGIFSKIPHAVLAQQVVKHGYLKVERKWVAESLPEMELLDATAYVFGKLSTLNDEAHHQIGLSGSKTVRMREGSPEAVPGGGPQDGRLPCMVAVDQHRSLMIELATGHRAKIRQEPFETAKEALEVSRDRYKLDHEFLQDADMKTLAGLSRSYFKIARRMFETDKAHIALAVLIQKRTPIAHLVLGVENRADKYMIARQLASEVERYNADAIMLINEVWSADLSDLRPFEYPSESAHKTEHLQLYVCSAAGEEIWLSAEIHRTEDSVELAETVEIDPRGSWIFEPVRETWRRLYGKN
jgi:hypothetical protein